MPKFLAVNYLQEAVVQHKLLLDHMLISIPDWFEEKHGTKKDDNFIKDIKSKHDCKADLLNLPFENKDDWTDLQRFSPISKLEKYQSEVVFHQTAYGSFELVPSSNPYSQESVDDSILMKLCDEVKSQTGAEDFPKESLENPAGLLEETTEINILKNYLNNQRGVRELGKKLKLKVVRDPFVTQDGKDISEEHVFREDLQYVCSQTQSVLRTHEDVIEVKEPFYKEVIVDKERDSIEENLMEDLTREDSETGRNPEVFPKDILKNLQSEDTSEIVSTAEELRQLGVAGEDVMRQADSQLSGSGGEEGDNRQCDQDDKDRDHHLMDLPQEATSPQPQTDGYHKALLESPEECYKVPDYESSKMFIPWQKEQPFQVSWSDASDATFLSEQKKMDLVNRFTFQEMVINDMLTFTLPVPSIPRNTVDVRPKVAKEKLKLLPEECTAEIELALSWDFISSSEKAMEESSKNSLMITPDPVVLEQKSVNFAEPDKAHFDDDLSMEQIDIGDLNPELKLKIPKSLHSEITIPGGEDVSCNKIETQKVTSVSGFQKEQERGKLEPSHLQICERNPFDDFLLMRKNTFTKTSAAKTSLAAKGSNHCEPSVSDRYEEISHSQEVEESCNDKVQDRSFMSQKSDSTFMETCNKADFTPDRMSTKKSKTKIIEVAFNGLFMSVVQALEDTAEPFLSLLQVSGLIPTSQTFTMFTPEVSTFIITQHQKAIRDRGDLDISSDKTFQAVVVLHILVSCLDSFLHGCLHSAIMTLSSLQDTHKTVLKGVLGDIRQELFEWNHKIQQSKLLHPKLSHLCEALAQWYLRKLTKSPDHDIKILIVCKNQGEHLLQEIAECVQQVEGIHTQVEAVEDQLSYQTIIRSLDQSNCLVVCQQQIGEHFPWAQFSLVIEYSNTPLSKIMEDCNRQSIRYIGLKLKSLQSQIAVDLQRKCDATEFTATKNTNLNQESLNQQIIVIGSENLTAKSELLHFLETRNNMTVIERDYGNLDFQLDFADVIIDERTCALLYDLAEFKESVDLQLLYRKISAMELKYQTCWLLLLSSSQEAKTGYPYPGSTVDNISKLLARIAHSVEGFSVKVVYCRHSTDAAQLIRSLTEDALHRSVAEGRCTEEAWLSRAWLTPDITRSSVQELRKKFAWLQPNVIEMFVNMVNKTLPMLDKHPDKKTALDNTSRRRQIDHSGEIYDMQQSEPQEISTEGHESNAVLLNSYREKSRANYNREAVHKGKMQTNENIHFPSFNMFYDGNDPMASHVQGREIHEALQTPLEFLNSRVKSEESCNLSPICDRSASVLDCFTSRSPSHPISASDDLFHNQYSSEVGGRQNNAHKEGDNRKGSSTQWQELGNRYQDIQRGEEHFQNFFQDARTKTPSIAPVTPRVREPMGFRDFNIEENGTAYSGPMRQSPPMDYDSDDEYDMSVHMQPVTYGPPSAFRELNPYRASNSDRNVSENYIHERDMNERLRWSSTGSLTPNKQRRLTYTAVPGSLSGQTRLSFQ